MRRTRILLFLIIFALPGVVSAEGFTGWSRTSTEHFVFVYEKQDQAVVDELVSFAESVYSDVTRFFGSYPRRIWVVVDSHVDTANGYYAGGTVPSHIVLFVTPPSVPVLGTKERQFLRLLLTHELTHYVHLNYDRGFFSVLSHLLGPAVRSADSLFLPDWMTEGVAVYNETAFTHGGRGRDPFFDMESRALVLEDRFFSLRQAAYASAFPPLDRVYLGGYLVVGYLQSHYGAETFSKIQRRFAAFPFFGPWAAIEKVTGRSAERIYRDMQQELRRKYAKYASIPAGTQLSPDRIGNYYLPLITSRGWYGYRDNLDSPPSIVEYDPATRKESVLVDTLLTDYSSLTATSDGAKIVFASFDVTLGPAGTHLTSDLFSLNPSTRSVHRLTDAKHLWQPALSPDGAILVAVQRAGAYTRLVSVDQKTGRVAPLFSRSETNVYNPVISPDGRLLAFALNDHGRQRIMLLDLPRSGGRVPGPFHARTLPDQPDANAFFPRFVDDGHIAFTADLGRGLALYEAGVEGGMLRRVVEDRVGVAAGELLGDRAIYTTFSTNGTVIREKPVERVPIEAQGITKNTPPPDAAAASSGELRRRASEASISRYVDWPRFLFWLPLPYYDYLPSGAQSIAAGFGAFVDTSSLLGRNSLQASLSFRTDVLQPSLSLSLTSMLGIDTLTYSLSHGYAELSGTNYEQSTSQSIGITFPLVAEHLLGVTTLLSLSPGVSDAFAFSSSTPFSIGMTFADPQSLRFAHRYSLNLGLSFTRAASDAPRDLYPTRKLTLDLRGQYYPPYLATGPGELGTVARGAISFPSFAPHQVLRLGLKTSFWSRVANRVPSVNPRGLFIPRTAAFDPLYSQTTSARTVLAADYLFNVRLLDTPLPFGFNIQGIAAGVHLAGAADWDPATATFVPDRSLYAGVELVSLIGYQAGGDTLPVGIGVSVRFDPSFSRPFDPLHDIGPYIFFDMDSFLRSAVSLPAAAQARTSGAPVLAQPRVDF